MKKPLLLLTGLGVFLCFSLNHLSAQDKKPAKVTITITEDDKVTTDTTFELKEGQDPEMIKKIVSKIAGEDIKMNISKSMSHSTIAMIHSDDDVEWHAKKSGDFEYHFGDLGMNLDSIKEAHGGERILVMKDEDGNITVKELGDGEDHMMLHGDDIQAKKNKVMIITDGEEGDHMIKTMDQHMTIIAEEGDEEGETKVIVKSLGMDEDDEIEKTINVWVTTDEDCEGGEEDVEVYVIKKGDKDVKVVKKKIMIEIDDEDGDVDEDEDQEDDKKEKKK